MFHIGLPEIMIIFYFCFSREDTLLAINTYLRDVLLHCCNKCFMKKIKYLESGINCMYATVKEAMLLLICIIHYWLKTSENEGETKLEIIAAQQTDDVRNILPSGDNCVTLSHPSVHLASFTNILIFHKCFLLSVLLLVVFSLQKLRIHVT